ncbi:hypothetical protein FRB90_004729 [Tulasnella sp. 427]|nr:hypothetical protein FRB90_004729 [Tulasnella sp. 427]
MVQFSLSAIEAPDIQTLQIDTQMRMGQSGLGDLLDANLYHMIRTLQSMLASAKEIKIMFADNGRVNTYINGLELRLDAVGNTLGYFWDNLHWLESHLGHQVRNVPYHLHFLHYDQALEHLQWFTSNLKVTKITVESGIWTSDHRFTVAIVRLLARPYDAASTPIWLLPYLEVISVEIVEENGRITPDVQDLVERRVSASGVQGAQAVPALTRLRGIKLSYGGKKNVTPAGALLALFRNLQTISEGVEIYWEDERWTGVAGRHK